MKKIFERIKIFETFKNKRILITGHTGFKGSWLSFWLSLYGANILGVSKDVPSKPSMYKVLKLKNKVKDKFINIKDLNKTKKIILDFKPDYIFHLAAQSIVKKSYDNPIDTIYSNTIGTVNILECARYLKNKCNLIIITSDKSYKNLEIDRGYTENDILGGHDPYSGSKAAAEMLINSYLNSFFNYKDPVVRICVSRAGNVIGGGDWSKDRVIPDCMRSWSQNKTAILRSPNSTRPWQHVLEAVGGYMMLALRLNFHKKLHKEIFNFGPSNKNNFKVIDLIYHASKFWKNPKWKIAKPSYKNRYYESKLLKLNSIKAQKILKWKSILNFKQTSTLVSEWYKVYYQNKSKDIVDLTIEQISFYSKQMKEKLNLK